MNVVMTATPVRVLRAGVLDGRAGYDPEIVVEFQTRGEVGVLGLLSFDEEEAGKLAALLADCLAEARRRREASRG